MSPLVTVLCLVLVSFASAGIIPSGRNGAEYHLAVNYHNEGLEASSRQIVNQKDHFESQKEASPSVNDQFKNDQKSAQNQAGEENVENSSSKKSSDSGSENNYYRQQQDANPSEASPSESSPTTSSEPSSDSSSQHQNSPLTPQIASAAGSVSYAYHGQTQQSSSSRVSQSLTSNVHAFPGQPAEVTHHFTELPAANVAFYHHPEELHSGAVVTVAHPATAYLHPERPQIVATHGAILGPSTVTTYQTAPATITHFTAVQPPPPRPVSEQSFSVNVASAKYGYGYTVRGVQHAH